MPQWQQQRNVASMRLTAEMAADAGVPLADSLACTGVRAPQLSDPEFTVSGQQELRLIRNVIARLGDRAALGLGAGARYHFTAYGALGFAMVSSRSVRSALDVGLQYFNLTFAFVRFVVYDSERETRVLIADDDAPEDVAQFVIERAIGALITVTRDLHGPAPMLRQVELRSPEPTDISGYEGFFGLKPRFGAKSNLIAFDRRRLESPLLMANEPTRQAAIEQCRRLLEARKARNGLASKVRNRLVTASAQMPTMESVAAELCMTPRTLRRHLLDEGTGFTELRDEVRQMLADELLGGPRLSIEQIAERLGYAETASFINAFKRWHGTTPHAFRLRSQKHA